MTESEKFQKTVDLVKKFRSDFKVTYKKDSKLHKLIGWCLAKIGNKQYMTDFITTLGANVALPEGIDENTANLWQCILHEGRHAIDGKKLTAPVFNFLYLFPQILGIILPAVSLVLVTCGFPVFLWGLLTLALLAPIPAIGRTWLELRGYSVTVASMFWSGSINNQDDIINYLEQIFTTGAYYWMWPFKSFINWYFAKEIIQLQTNTYALDGYLAACKVLSKEFLRD